MAVAVTATVQPAYPPRIALSVTGLTAGDDLTIYRSVAGVRTPVRSANEVTATVASFVIVDAEQPFGVPVTYVAHVNGSDAATTAASTYILTGGKVAISDAIGGAAAEVVILAWPELRRDRDSATFVVSGRTIVVSSPFSGASSRIDLLTESDSARDNLMALIKSATEGVLQIRQPGGYAGVDCYVAVREMTEKRWSQDGSDPRRIWSLDIVEVEPWTDVLALPISTLQDVADAYFGETLADVAADYATLVELQFGYFGA